jgi:hypothetical protein
VISKSGKSTLINYFDLEELELGGHGFVNRDSSIFLRKKQLMAELRYENEVYRAIENQEIDEEDERSLVQIGYCIQRIVNLDIPALSRELDELSSEERKDKSIFFED